MKRRFFSPSRSMLGGPPKMNEDKKSWKNWDERKKNGASIPFGPPPIERQQQWKPKEKKPRMVVDTLCYPQPLEKAKNEIDNSRPVQLPIYINDAVVIDEARRFLDVDVFAVEDEKLPLLLQKMLEMELNLQKVLARKEDIRCKMMKLYEQEAADTKACLGKLERTIKSVPVGMPGGVDKRIWLHEAREAFTRIDLPHKSSAKNLPSGPVPGFPTVEPIRGNFKERRSTTPKQSPSRPVSRSSPLIVPSQQPIKQGVSFGAPPIHFAPPQPSTSQPNLLGMSQTPAVTSYSPMPTQFSASMPAMSNNNQSAVQGPTITSTSYSTTPAQHVAATHNLVYQSNPPTQGFVNASYSIPQPIVEQPAVVPSFQPYNFSQPPPTFTTQMQSPWTTAVPVPITTYQPNHTREGLPNFNLGMY